MARLYADLDDTTNFEDVMDGSGIRRMIEEKTLNCR